MSKKIAFVVIIILVILFYNLSKQIYDSLQAGRRLDMETERLGSLQQKNSDLKKKLSEVGTMKFIEAQARDKLNMVRGNETMMIIPQKELNKVLESWQEKKEEIIPNWQGWLRLFFK